jgi:TolB protein
VSNLKTVGALLPLLLASYLPSSSIANAHLTQDRAASLGIFGGNGDVGTVLHAGSAEYDPHANSYTVTGSGENMWFGNDAFQFVWKKVSGDVTLTADVSLIGTGGDNHRKAVLMIRQSLDADAPYADAALHGDGLTSLQFRDQKGVNTHEVQANVSGPALLRLMKRGDRFYLWTAAAGEALQFAGGSARVQLAGDYYVGIGVCAHNKDAVQKASFSDVEIVTGRQPAALPARFSTLETVAVASTDARAIYVSPVSPNVIGSPNWSPDGKALLFDRSGGIERVAVAGGKAEAIETGLRGCNSSHGISPDGKLLAVSASVTDGPSNTFIVPVGGGQARELVSQLDSYFHSWSPDGSTISFSGRVSGKWNVYTVPAAGGRSNQLTDTGAFNDGPEFSADGKFIYFTSDRGGGSMQIWRMKVDGSEPQQVTNGEGWNNAFPHVSPDGTQIAFLSFPPGDRGYGYSEDVQLRVMSLVDRKVKVLSKFVGGSGSMDSPSWSPDSKRVAFVSYQVIQ